MSLKKIQKCSKADNPNIEEKIKHQQSSHIKQKTSRCKIREMDNKKYCHPTYVKKEVSVDQEADFSKISSDEDICLLKNISPLELYLRKRFLSLFRNLAELVYVPETIKSPIQKLTKEKANEVTKKIKEHDAHLKSEYSNDLLLRFIPNARSWDAKIDSRSIEYLTNQYSRVVLCLYHLCCLNNKYDKGQSMLEKINCFLNKTKLLNKKHLMRVFLVFMEQKFEKALKSFFNYPLARVATNRFNRKLKNIKYEYDDPVPREGIVNYTYLFGNCLRKFINRHVPCGLNRRFQRKKIRKILNFCVTLQRIKKATLRVPESFIDDSFLDYRDKLTKIPPSRKESAQTYWNELPNSERIKVTVKYHNYKKLYTHERGMDMESGVKICIGDKGEFGRSYYYDELIDSICHVDRITLEQLRLFALAVTEQKLEDTIDDIIEELMEYKVLNRFRRSEYGEAFNMTDTVLPTFSATLECSRQYGGGVAYQNLVQHVYRCDDNLQRKKVLKELLDSFPSVIDLSIDQENTSPSHDVKYLLNFETDFLSEDLSFSRDMELLVDGKIIWKDVVFNLFGDTTMVDLCKSKNRNVILDNIITYLQESVSMKDIDRIISVLVLNQMNSLFTCDICKIFKVNVNSHIGKAIFILRKVVFPFIFAMPREVFNNNIYDLIMNGEPIDDRRFIVEQLKNKKFKSAIIKFIENEHVVYLYKKKDIEKLPIHSYKKVVEDKIEINKVHSQKGFNNLYNGTYRTSEAHAKVIAIVEPLKIRWLNCTETLLGYRTIKFNHLVGNLVRENEVFFPSGEPVQLKHIKFLEKFKFACSQDYSGATDTILCRYSAMVLRKLCIKMFGVIEGLKYYEGTECALTRFHLMYKDGKPFKQTMGQLMGSNLSFPILCILNAAINKLHLDPKGEKKLVELPLRVNGDDNVYGLNEEGYYPLTIGTMNEYLCISERQLNLNEIIFDPDGDSLEDICSTICKSDNNTYSPKMNSVWHPIISLVGFSSSPGKCYIHEKFCCINSVYFFREDESKNYSRVYPTQLSLMFNDPEESNSDLGNRKNKDLREKEEVSRVKTQKRLKKLKGDIKKCKLSKQDRETIFGRASNRPDGWVSTLGGNSHKLCFHMSVKDKNYLMRHFLHYNRYLLKKIRRNYYTPPNMGGLGIFLMPLIRETVLGSVEGYRKIFPVNIQKSVSYLNYCGHNNKGIYKIIDAAGGTAAGKKHMRVEAKVKKTLGLLPTYVPTGTKELALTSIQAFVHLGSEQIEPDNRQHDYSLLFRGSVRKFNRLEKDGTITQLASDEMLRLIDNSNKYKIIDTLSYLELPFELQVCDLLVETNIAGIDPIRRYNYITQHYSYDRVSVRMVKIILNYLNIKGVNPCTIEAQ